MRKIITIIALLLVAQVAQSQNNWTVYNVANSDIGGNTILALEADAKNNLWVGTNLGLCRLSGRTWTDYSQFNNKLKDQFVNCLTVDGNGVLWIGTDDFGVIEFDGTRWTEHTQQTRQLSMKFIRDIVIDRRGTRWIGVTLGGLVKFDTRGEWTKYMAKESGLLSDFILSIAIDAQNNKWIGTNDGLCVFDGNSWTSYTTRNSKIASDIVPSIAIDKENVKWVGTLGGLCRYDGNEWKIYSQRNSPLPSNQINGLAFDDTGALWIATDKGIAVFDGKSSWQVYDKNNSSLPSLVIQNLTIDSRGNKWFGTDFNGLVRFAAHGIKGRIADEQGNGKAGVEIVCGSQNTTTDNDGYYYIEVPTNATLKLQPQDIACEPAERSLTAVNGFLFGQDFTVSRAAVAQAGPGRVIVTPYLEDGYVTISFDSPTAEVEFVDAKGNTARKIAQYKNGGRITITKLHKGAYTIYVRTDKGERTVQFTLK